MLMMLVLRLTKFRQSLGRAAALAVGSKTARSERERESLKGNPADADDARPAPCHSISPISGSSC